MNRKQALILSFIIGPCIILGSFIITLLALFYMGPLLSQFGLVSSVDNNKLDRVIDEINTPNQYIELNRKYHSNSIGSYASVYIIYKPKDGTKASKDDFVMSLKRAGFINTYDKSYSLSEFDRYSYMKQSSLSRVKYYIQLTDDNDNFTSEAKTNEVHLDLYMN